MSKSKVAEWFFSFEIVKRIVDWSQSYSPPGFSGVSLYNVITFLIKETQKDNLTTRANAISFSLFLSIFPAFVLPIVQALRGRVVPRVRALVILPVQEMAAKVNISSFLCCFINFKFFNTLYSAHLLIFYCNCNFFFLRRC